MLVRQHDANAGKTQVQTRGGEVDPGVWALTHSLGPEQIVLQSSRSSCRLRLGLQIVHHLHAQDGFSSPS